MMSSDDVREILGLAADLVERNPKGLYTRDAIVTFLRTTLPDQICDIVFEMELARMSDLQQIPSGKPS